MPKDGKVGPFASRPVGFEPTRPETDVKAPSFVASFWPPRVFPVQVDKLMALTCFNISS